MNHLGKGCADLHLTQLNFFQTTQFRVVFYKFSREKKKKKFVYSSLVL